MFSPLLIGALQLWSSLLIQGGFLNSSRRPVRVDWHQVCFLVSNIEQYLLFLKCWLDYRTTVKMLLLQVLVYKITNNRKQQKYNHGFLLISFSTDPLIICSTFICIIQCQCRQLTDNNVSIAWWHNYMRRHLAFQCLGYQNLFPK